jgi:hypothetical protein
MRATILIAFAAVLVFATPAYMRDSFRSTQEDHTKPPQTKPPAEAPPRVIAMTAKYFQFDPAEIHLKIGEKLRLQVAGKQFVAIRGAIQFRGASQINPCGILHGFVETFTRRQT